MHYYDMVQISAAAFKSWERFYRAHFLNSLSGIKPVSLIATVNENGQPNLAVFSNIVHLGADPALVGFINRPLEAAPHTIANVERTGVYTINHIHEEMMQQAHQTSAKYDASVNEFDAVGLTPAYMPTCKAPYVQESKIRYALQLQQIIPIERNGTFLVIGEVTDVMLDENLIEPDGFINLSKAGSMGSIGIDGYSVFEAPVRFQYAKPGKQAERL
jgi:flavin reductase (DIM6/NTAB) family NADH-FMN oxidoreductase RutF